jgi:hypothetical protein
LEQGSDLNVKRQNVQLFAYQEEEEEEEEEAFGVMSY